MLKQSFSRSTIAVLLLVFLIWPLTTVAQSPGDPWARVPAIPAGCYATDDFTDKIGAAKTALNEEITRQSEVNRKFEENFRTMDPLLQAQKMQEFMMKNPQEAMKIMQAMQAGGQAATASVNTVNDDALKLEKELTTLKASYTAALDAALKPVQARRTEMIKARTDPAGEGGAFRFKTAAFEAEYIANVQQENTEYERVCASYMGPNGQFAKWLVSYKTLVTEKMIVTGEEMTKVVEAQMLILNPSGSGYRSTAKLEGVRNYLDRISAVYPTRWPKATIPGHMPIGR